MTAGETNAGGASDTSDALQLLKDTFGQVEVVQPAAGITAHEGEFFFHTRHIIVPVTDGAPQGDDDGSGIRVPPCGDITPARLPGMLNGAYFPAE